MMIKLKILLILLCLLFTACNHNVLDKERIESSDSTEYELLCNKQWYSRGGEIYFSDDGEGIYRYIYYALNPNNTDPDQEAERYSILCKFNWQMTDDKAIVLEIDDENGMYFYENGTYLWEEDWTVDNGSLTIDGDVYSDTPLN